MEKEGHMYQSAEDQQKRKDETGKILRHNDLDDGNGRGKKQLIRSGSLLLAKSLMVRTGIRKIRIKPISSMNGATRKWFIRFSFTMSNCPLL